MAPTAPRTFTISCRACNGSQEYPEGDTLEALTTAQREFFAEHQCLPTPAPLPGWVLQERRAEAAALAVEGLRERELAG